MAPKLKASADNKLNVNKMFEFPFVIVENIVGKEDLFLSTVLNSLGENVQIIILPQMIHV